ncbi:MAG: hypothetical protein JWP25_4225 [Bradyrhizobium sp.]|nr:hypothetical protein [Bradyrhizobium sp.]
MEKFADLLRRNSPEKSQVKSYGPRGEIGPLGIPDPYLCPEARDVLRGAMKAYLATRKDPDMLPLQRLAEKHGVPRYVLGVLAKSGSIPTIRFEHLKKAPVLMSDAALALLVDQMRNAISASLVKIGVHRMHLKELEKRGLLEKVEGPVLKLLKPSTYYTRESVESLKNQRSLFVSRMRPCSLRLKTIN